MSVLLPQPWLCAGCPLNCHEMALDVLPSAILRGACVPSPVRFAANLTRIRGNARMYRGMEGDYITDFCSCLVLYPLVATQLGEEIDVNGPLVAKVKK